MVCTTYLNLFVYFYIIYIFLLNIPLFWNKSPFIAVKPGWKYTADNFIRSTSLKNNLVCIASNTTFLANCITKLESQNLSLIDSLGIVNDTVRKLKDAPGEVGIQITKNIEQVLSKNPGLETIEAIANVHNGSDKNLLRLQPLLNYELCNLHL